MRNLGIGERRLLEEQLMLRINCLACYPIPVLLSHLQSVWSLTAIQVYTFISPHSQIFTYINIKEDQLHFEFQVLIEDTNVGRLVSHTCSIVFGKPIEAWNVWNFLYFCLPPKPYFIHYININEYNLYFELMKTAHFNETTDDGGLRFGNWREREEVRRGTGSVASCLINNVSNAFKQCEAWQRFNFLYFGLAPVASLSLE